MKAKAADLDGVLRARRLPPGVRLVLLCGPDEAASREWAGRLASVLADPADPMARVDIAAADLGSDPGRLADEAAAVSMFGGSTVIRVDGAGEAAREAAELLLGAPAAGNPVLMVAGDLKKDSKLRLAAEGSPAALCLVSYAAEGRDADALAADRAAALGLKPSRAALRALLGSTGGDRGVMARELEKLALYLDASPERPQPLEPEHLAAVGAGLDEADFTGLVEAVAGGDPAAADRQLGALAGQGLAGIPLLRAVQRRLWLLLDLRTAVDAGASPQAAVAAARPPVFFKERDGVAAQLARWRTPQLHAALARLLEAERAIKAPASPGDVLASQSLLALSVQAARERPRR